MPEAGSDSQDPAGLSLVIAGSCPFGTWELRDAPHPLPQDPHAVEHQLLARYNERSGGGTYEGVGARVTGEQLAVIPVDMKGLPGAEIGFVEARCNASVSDVIVQWDDGVEDRISAVRSPSTGECWVICRFDSSRVPRRLRFLDDANRTLISREISDPRSARPVRPTSPGLNA